MLVCIHKPVEWEKINDRLNLHRKDGKNNRGKAQKKCVSLNGRINLHTMGNDKLLPMQIAKCYEKRCKGIAYFLYMQIKRQKFIKN